MLLFPRRLLWVAAVVMLLRQQLVVASDDPNGEKEAPTCDGSEKECAADYDEGQCTRYIAESSIPNAGLGVYTTVDFESGDYVYEDEVFVPIIDPDMSKTSQLYDYVWDVGVYYDLIFESNYHLEVSEDGPPGNHHSLLSNTIINFFLNRHEHKAFKDSVGLHRFKDPGTGAFSMYHGMNYVATRHIEAGSELFLDYGGAFFQHRNIIPLKKGDQMADHMRTPEWLEENGLCIDKMRYGNSTIRQAGRGAFAKRFIRKGSIIAPAPMIIVNRDVLVMHKPMLEEDDDGFVFTDEVVGTQLLLNYCYGHPDSSVLLLPHSSLVYFINHNGTAPNAEIRWSNSPLHQKDCLSLPPSSLFKKGSGLIMEFVALRDIRAGEEIFIDYGREWEEAWDKHVKEWKPKEDDKDYISANDYIERGLFAVRTLDEQETNPYPSNLQTVCYFTLQYEWKDSDECLLPCNILSWEEESGVKSFTVEAKNIVNAHFRAGDDCILPDDESLIVHSVPAEAITVVDRPYTSDQHLAGAFRHEIGVPEGFFPRAWMN